MTDRWDETWHRLREWTSGQAPSERLAAQILLHEGYINLDPSHPLGGKDGGKDAVCDKDNLKYLMAVYFPRGQQEFNDIKKKFLHDLKGVKSNSADALVFVTNQELRLAEREDLKNAEGEVSIELFHLERITAILDRPDMAGVRKQFLGIDYNETAFVSLGGEGGKAPGAGGGGGGALGLGAQGGEGGFGGDVYFLDGQPAEAPGAGGGGGGAIGDGAVGGDGGSGGEYKTASFLIADLLALGDSPGVLEVQVGRGGKGGENGNGEDGEDTTVSLRQADGSKIELLRAKGGKSGRIPAQEELQQMNPASGKVCISSALLANYAEVKDGLLYTLGCGWDSYTVDSFPSLLCGYFIFVTELGEAGIGTRYELSIGILDSESEVIAQAPVFIENQSSFKIVRQNSLVPFQVDISAPGIWSVQVLFGDDELVRLPFEVRQRS